MRFLLALAAAPPPRLARRRPARRAADHARRPGRLHPGHDRHRPAARLAGHRRPRRPRRLDPGRNGRRSDGSALPAVHFRAGGDPRRRRHAALQAAQRQPRPGRRPACSGRRAPTTTTSCAPTRSTIRCASTASTRASAARSAARRRRSRSDKWHSLRLIASNDRFEVSLDGKVLFTATDRSLPQSGAMGVWSQADSVTHYGSLLVGPVMR